MNTKSILVCNCKGGTGKTCISTEIAFSLQQRGANVVFLELDKQGGAVMQPSAPNDETDYIVIDTPGYITDEFPDWCEGADYIVIPTLASSEDMEPFIKTWNKIKKSGSTAPRGIIVNRYDDHRIVDQDYIEGLQMIGGLDIIAQLPVATAMTAAHGDGTGVVVADPSAKISQRIEAGVDTILQTLGDARFISDEAKDNLNDDQIGA